MTVTDEAAPVLVVRRQIAGLEPKATGGKP